MESQISNMWLLLCSFFMFFMQAGFAMVESGLNRAKNAGNIIMKNLFDYSIGSVIFFLVGFSLMFGTAISEIWDPLVLSSSKLAHTAGGFKSSAFILFHSVFAATSATIVSGTMAERTRFKSYIVFTVLMTAFIYPVSGHWIWGDGWLAKRGFIDFAGSTVVHSVGGWAALVGTFFLGPRIGKYKSDGTPNAIPGHNLPIASLGVFILWLGWFCFNAGKISDMENFRIAFIVINTNLSAATSAITSMFGIWFLRATKPDLTITLNGILAGLVAITAGCANVSPTSALVIGAVAGIVVVLSIEFFDFILKIDDPVGAISVHGVCGALGTLMVGLFAQEQYGGAKINGLFFGGGFTILQNQLIGILAILGWVLLTSAVSFFIIKKVMGLRVTKEVELKGLDLSEHKIESYPEFQIFHHH